MHIKIHEWKPKSWLHLSLLLLQHWASFSKLSWSDLSLVKWQLSALKDFLKREERVIQGESVQFSFTPTHSILLYFLLRFLALTYFISTSHSCILMHPWHRWVVHSLSTTLLSSIALTIFLVHTVSLSPRILWAMTLRDWVAGSGLDGVTPKLTWQNHPCWSGLCGQYKPCLSMSCWVWKGINVRVCKAQGQKQG